MEGGWGDSWFSLNDFLLFDVFVINEKNYGKRQCMRS